MKTITLSITEELGSDLESKAFAQGYETAEAYVEDLIRHELGWEPAEIERELRKRLENHDPSKNIVWTPEEAEKLKREFLERHRRERGEVA